MIILETFINELIEIFLKVLGHEIKPEYVSPRIGEVRRISLDADMAKKELSFVPKYSLPEGISIVVKENGYRGVNEYRG